MSSQMARPSVSLFLSVFQGSAYIQEQLESLQKQHNVDITLYFHSDGLDPDVDELILESDLNAVQVDLDPGLGLPRAYFDVLRKDQPPSDFYAFCDQDDIWHSRKLLEATTALRTLKDIPGLWVCRVRPFTEVAGVRSFGMPYPEYIAKPSFGNALVETIGPGCAMVWNQALHDILVAGNSPQGALMHDSWLYLTAAAFGQVLVEPEVLVDYRIHDSNAVGMRRNILSRVGRLAKAIADPSIPTLESQALSFKRKYGDNLGEQEALALEVVLSGNSIVRGLAWRRGTLSRQRRLDNYELLPRLLFHPGSWVRAKE